jgi:polysaccharide biosynthesis transport protein
VAHEGFADDGRSRLRSQLRAVARRWKLIGIAGAVGMVLALAYSATEPSTYRASADVLLSPTTFDVQRGGASISAEEIATQTQVAISRPVAEMVQDELGLAQVPDLQDLVAVEALGSSRVLRVTATSPNRDEATELAAAVATQFLSYRRTDTQRSLSEVASTLSDRQQQLEDRIDRLDRALATGGGQRTGELEAERRNLLSQLGQITSQLAGLDISVSAGAGGDVLKVAETPDEPVAPRPLLTGALGLLAGLLIGIAVALLRNRLDDVVHDEDAVRESLGDVEILGWVPRWKAGRHDDGLVTVSLPSSRAGQAIQSLATTLRARLFRGRGAHGDSAVVLCTSAGPSEGKTTVAANLGVAAARVGMRVVVIDADLRRDGGERFPYVDQDARGLADLVHGDARLEDCLVDGPIDGLRLLPSGVASVDPNELAASPRMDDLLAHLSRIADLVIVDTAPTLEYADALELAERADLVLLVTSLGQSRSTTLSGAAERLHQASGSEVGAVVIGARKQGHQPHLRGRGGADRQQPPAGRTRVLEAPASQRGELAERSVG